MDGTARRIDGADETDALEGPALWRRQQARHLMDCYALAMESALHSPSPKRQEGALEDLVRWMVEGITVVRSLEDERSFYKTAAQLCRECAALTEGGKPSSFRIYAAVFEGMAEEREGL